MISLETGHKYLKVIKNGIRRVLPSDVSLFQNTSTKLSGLKADTFEKNSALPLLERTDAQIKETIRQTLKTQIIGKGAEARVYRIPDTDYVLRVHNGKSPDFKELVSFDMSARDRVNHYVAKLGKNVEIGEFIDGTLVSLNSLGKRNKEVLEKQHHLNLEIVDMPVSCYKNFIKDLFDAAKLNMSFDHQGRNIIVDNSRTKFIPIDFEYGFSKNPTFKVFNPILNMQSGFSVSETDLQFKFLKKVIGGFAELAKSKYDFNLEYCKLDACIHMLPFNLKNINDMKSFSNDVKIINKSLNNVVSNKLMNSRSPMFLPQKSVNNSVDELMYLTGDFVNKYL